MTPPLRCSPYAPHLVLALVLVPACGGGDSLTSRDDAPEEPVHDESSAPPIDAPSPPPAEPPPQPEDPPMEPPPMEPPPMEPPPMEPPPMEPPPGEPPPSERPPQCVRDEDCLGTVDNSAGCYDLGCDAGTCTATRRHDGPDWRVDPALTPEIRIGDAGHPQAVSWDGEAFIVVWGTQARRYDRAGNPLGPAFLLDPAFTDVTYDAAGERLIVVTQEQPDATHARFWVGYYTLSRTGGLLTPKTEALYDQSSDSGNARVAAGPAGFVVVGALNAQSYGKLFRRDGGTSVFTFTPLLQNWLVRGPNVAAHKDRFVYAAMDQHWWIGCDPATECTWSNCPDVWGAAIGADGWPTASWSQLVDLSQPSPCNTAGTTPAFVSGNRGMLLASAGDGAYGTVQVRALSDSLQPGPQTNFESVSRLWLGVPVPLGFDGRHYLVAPETAGQLIAYRFTEDGAQLDPTPFALVPPGTIATHPRLGGDRAGRYLIAYEKPSGIYIRLFSTCP